jgi:hypothetical protein
MKRCRVEVEHTKRTDVEFDVDDEADDEEIKETALEEAELEEAELADWEEEPAEVVSIQVIESC